MPLEGDVGHLDAGIGDHPRRPMFEVAPVKAFAFGKREPYSQTRYRFS